MKQHGNSSLTVSQRKMIHELYHSGKAKKIELARRFNVNKKTIDKWTSSDTPFDKPSGPKNPRKVVTPEYRKAVISYRQSHPDYGPITIAHYLKTEFSFANRGTIQRILQQEGLSKRIPGEKKNDAS